MKRLGRELHDLWCAVSGACEIAFRGDDYTDWLRDQEEAAKAANAALAERKRIRETGNVLEDAIRFSRRDKGEEV